MKCWNDIPKFFFFFLFSFSVAPRSRRAAAQTHNPETPRYIQKRVKIQIREKEWLKKE
jgi:hypothetical protein